jgi:hypothetical protein
MFKQGRPTRSLWGSSRGRVSSPARRIVAGYHFSYLYSVYMRIRELLEIYRLRFRADGKREVEGQYENVSNSVTEVYNSQSASQKYDITEILTLVNRNQNARLLKFFPSKRASRLAPIESPRLIDKLRESSPERKSTMRKTISVELMKSKEAKM